MAGHSLSRDARAPYWVTLAPNLAGGDRSAPKPYHHCGHAAEGPAVDCNSRQRSLPGMVGGRMCLGLAATLRIAAAATRTRRRSWPGCMSAGARRARRSGWFRAYRTEPSGTVFANMASSSAPAAAGTMRTAAPGPRKPPASCTARPGSTTSSCSPASQPRPCAASCAALESPPAAREAGHRSSGGGEPPPPAHDAEQMLRVRHALAVRAAGPVAGRVVSGLAEPGGAT